MDELVRQVHLGDITFGAPADIPLLHKPWGYYSLLGVATTATYEEIRQAYRDMAKELHPDRHGEDRKPFQTLNHVAEILLDDGGELGHEHSRRRHYDEVCSYDSLFDGFITTGKDRTKKLSEIILINLEFEKKHAEAEHDIAEKFPEFSVLKEKLVSSLSAGDQKSADQIAHKLQEMATKAAEITPEALEQFRQARKEAEERYEKKQRDFIDSFRDSPRAYIAKILDIFYTGGGNVTFGTNKNYMRLGIAGHDDREHILELILGGECYISGFPKVHFKAPEANVSIQDPNVEGIFHVVSGSVNVRYESSTYGGVIRARAPHTNGSYGFVQNGDLYVPEAFATGKWWEKKPAVDIAVKEGSVSLHLESPRFTYGKIFLPDDDKYIRKGGSRSLEDLLNNNLYSPSNLNKIYSSNNLKDNSKKIF
jgi:curved DNA-binding protein CbpA